MVCTTMRSSELLVAVKCAPSVHTMKRRRQKFWRWPLNYRRPSPRRLMTMMLKRRLTMMLYECEEADDDDAEEEVDDDAEEDASESASDEACNELAKAWWLRLFWSGGSDNKDRTCSTSRSDILPRHSCSHE